MDLLHKPVYELGARVHFLVSPVEEPYYYVRCFGEIIEQTITEDVVTYRIKLLGINESTEIIDNVICNRHFRVKSIKKKQHPYIDYRLYAFDASNAIELTNFISSMQTKLLDVPSVLVFDDQNAMDDKLIMINKFNIDVLVNRVDFLSKRNMQL